MTCGTSQVLQGQAPQEIHLDNHTIGKVAKEAGVNKETIRYYQSLGLVSEPNRRPGSVRRYGAPTADTRLSPLPQGRVSLLMPCCRSPRWRMMGSGPP